jgi:hypothetical protein
LVTFAGQDSATISLLASEVPSDKSIYLLFFFYYGQWQSLDGDSEWLMQTLQSVQLCISGAMICREITPGKDSDEKLKC